MRGGTSKAVFLNENHIPVSRDNWDKLILALFGSPDKRQIDGLGGGDILTSKCAIIGPSTRQDADIDYTFAQVGIEEDYVSYDINCGNISPSAGVYAIEEGFVRTTDPVTSVKIHNTNTNRVLIARIPTHNGKVLVEGDFQFDGVPGTGAEIKLDYSQTFGSATGKLLPTGNVKDDIYIPSLKKTIEISVVDLANLCVYFRAKDIGLKGTEKPDEITPGHFELFAEIREIVADLIELPKSNILLPFQIMVHEPEDYEVFSTAQTVTKDEIDFTGRMFAANSVHKAFPGTGSCCTAVAALINGTIVNEVGMFKETKSTVRIGHPSGVITLNAEVVKTDGDNWVVNEVTFSRTARRLMEGYAYILQSRL